MTIKDIFQKHLGYFLVCFCVKGDILGPTNSNRHLYKDQKSNSEECYFPNLILMALEKLMVLVQVQLRGNFFTVFLKERIKIKPIKTLLCQLFQILYTEFNSMSLAPCLPFPPLRRKQPGVFQVKKHVLQLVNLQAPQFRVIHCSRE